VSAGRVALVGAGPGDPMLLTLRAAELLREADVIAYDELVSPSILALAPACAERLAVGRRAGHGDTGYRLHPKVLDRVRAGKFVVRLKAGDPLIFGRGGEEAEELARAGIPFEIVPGITAALGAAAYSGIPLTHREHAGQVIFATGHRGDGGLPLPGMAAGRTLVLYMASRNLEANVSAIIAAGWPPSTPAALVQAATTADECTVVATLETLPTCASCTDHVATRLPGILIVGEVVALRAVIEWRGRASVVRKAAS